MSPRARTFAVLACWVVAAAVVRLGLAWADSYPYSSTSEWRYGLVATAALSIAIGGSVWVLLRNRRQG